MCVCAPVCQGGAEETRDRKERKGEGIEQNKGKKGTEAGGKERRRGRLRERTREMRG